MVLGRASNVCRLIKSVPTTAARCISWSNHSSCLDVLQLIVARNSEDETDSLPDLSDVDKPRIGRGVSHGGRKWPYLELIRMSSLRRTFAHAFQSVEGTITT